MKGRTIRKATLCLALGACLGSMAPVLMAQSVTGAVAGRAVAGEQITVTNAATGQRHTLRNTTEARMVVITMSPVTAIP